MNENHNIVTRTDDKLDPGATQDLGVVSGYVDSKFLSDRESFWTTIDGRLVFVGCGDDRGPTESSADGLMELMSQRGTLLDPTEGYASVYGGVAGEAKNVLVVGAAQYGKQFIVDMGGFDGIMGLLIENSRNPQTLHSAVGNENDQRYFCMQGNDSIGCAYCGGTGATSGLLLDPEDELIRNVGRQDQKFVFGSDNGFDDLLRGHELVLEYATQGKKTAFAFNRPEYKTFLEKYSSDLGMMMLAGVHGDALSSGVISNFSLDEVGNPYKANQMGLGFYRLDIAVATQTVLSALGEKLAEFKYNLSPELLMRAFQLDATPVRAVLASHDANPALKDKKDPRNLRMGTRGNPWEAMDTIEHS
jgi:hypothetical protein